MPAPGRARPGRRGSSLARAWLALVLLCTARAALALPQTAAVPGAAEAALELERASAHAAAGRYQRARESYERISERWPLTPAGREARLRLEPNALFGWADLLRHGPSESLVDVIVLGDGYVFGQQDAFDDVAVGVPAILERCPVFGEYFAYFNFVRANVVSAEAGVDGYGREVSTALDARVLESTNAGNVAVDPERVWTLLGRIPEFEGLAIAIVKRANSGTAAPGIATIGGGHFETLLHEWGHAFGGLGDEYATDLGFPYEGSIEHPNVSLTDDEERVPWAHWIAAGAPGIGAYEGAEGRVRGVWRPKASGCVMNDSDLFYCEPCREALVLAIYQRVDPILSWRVKDGPELGAEEELLVSEPVVLEARVLEPASHDLEASWWILPEAEAPELAAETRPRGERGPLALVAAKPAQERRLRGGRTELRVDPRDLAPGRWLVLLRVRDTTRVPNDRLPWVLVDERELLRSERRVWIRIP